MHYQRLFVATSLAVLVSGCSDKSSSQDDTGTETSDTSATVTMSSTSGPTSTTSSSTTTPSTSTTDPTTTGSESSSESTDTGVLPDVPRPDCAPNCPNVPLDILFVIDNSGTMGQEQLKLANAFPALFNAIDQAEFALDSYLDVNLMVTTTDFGNPLCTPFQNHDPERGAPISTGCNSRIDRFTGLGINPEVIPEACTDVCPTDIEPTDQFIHFDGQGDNVPDGTALDALECIGPQGIDGCGYEQPLENMLQALNPAACWNDPGCGDMDWDWIDEPWMRDGADLAIILITDEADCSVKNYSIMNDPMFMNINPDTNQAQPSSAICWNAGVACNGPDVNGVYTNCASLADDNLQPVYRYADYLDYLESQEGKTVLMLSIVGVPEVTEHDPDPPYAPTAGGVLDLEYHDWNDGEYPMGDILPAEWQNGVTAADKQFQFGIGPGCTGPDGVGGFSQAIPPVRIKEVCESLDGNFTQCCIESLCDDDFFPAMQCLGGMIQQSLAP